MAKQIGAMTAVAHWNIVRHVASDLSSDVVRLICEVPNYSPRRLSNYESSRQLSIHSGIA